MGIYLSDSYTQLPHLTFAHAPDSQPSESSLVIPLEEGFQSLVIQRSLEDPNLSVGNSTGYTRHLDIARLNLHTD